MNNKQGSYYIPPSLDRFRKEQDINPSALMRIALKDLKEKGFTIINLREVVKKTRKEKDLIGNGQ